MKTPAGGARMMKYNTETLPFQSKRGQPLHTGLGQVTAGLAPDYRDPGILGHHPLVANFAAYIGAVDDPVSILQIGQGGHIEAGAGFLTEAGSYRPEVKTDLGDILVGSQIKGFRRTIQRVAGLERFFSSTFQPLFLLVLYSTE